MWQSNRNINVFCGQNDIPATFQRKLHKTLELCENYSAFLEVIIIAAKGTLQEHEENLNKILHKLDNDELAISIQKRDSAKQLKEWLGLKITEFGVKALISKTETPQKLDQPKTLKQIRSCMGSIHS